MAPQVRPADPVTRTDRKRLSERGSQRQTKPISRDADATAFELCAVTQGALGRFHEGVRNARKPRACFYYITERLCRTIAQNQGAFT
jgi:hypothetical protein